MQYWIELGLIVVAGGAVVIVAFEGLRIYTGWRRSSSRIGNL